jgi:hypothetical protein
MSGDMNIPLVRGPLSTWQPHGPEHNDITLRVFEEVARKWLAHLESDGYSRLSNSDQKILCRVVISLCCDLRKKLDAKP